MLKVPQIDPTAFLAPDASVYGDVRIGPDCSVWFHATVRAENAQIHVGRGSNIQDSAVVHVDEGYPVEIGEDVTIGHGAIVHGCRVGDRTLVGMGAILLNGVVVGKDCIVGAGALITQNTVIPDGSLVLGSPARVKRKVRAEEVENSLRNAVHYVRAGREYAGFFRKRDWNPENTEGVLRVGSPAERGEQRGGSGA